MKLFSKLLHRFRESGENPIIYKATYDNSVKWNGGSVINYQNNNSNIQIGSNSVIEGKLIVNPYGGKIKIGENCFLGYNSRIQSDTGITIGNNVLISYNVNIIDNNAHEINYLQRRKSGKMILQEGFHNIKERGDVLGKEIFIEDDAWISLNVIILKGVRIGKGAIVGAGSVVTKDIPPFTISVGNPATVVKNIEH